MPRDSRLPSRSKSKAAKSDVRSRSTRTAKGGRPTFGWWPSVALIVAALCLAFVTLPAPTVERLYARGCYPAFQPFLTSLSSLVPIAVFDLLIVGLAAWAISRVYPVLRAGRGDRVRCAVIAFVDFAAGASVVELLRQRVFNT